MRVETTSERAPMLLPQVVCPVLVGREAELQALVEIVDRAVAGRGETVFLGGDAGIGKSRLCREFKHHAAARQARVVEGRCSSVESAVPYGPFMDALRFRLARGEGRVAAHVLGPIVSHLAPLLPELAAEADPAGDAHGSGERPFAAIFEVVERLTELGPLLLVLEDIHWADPTSRELLQYLSRRIRTLPVLIVATYRTDELHLRHPTRRLIAALTGERLAREIVLAPLTEEQVGRMVGAIIGGDPLAHLVEVIQQRAEGNPFFVEELLKGLADAGRLGPAAGAAAVERAELPATVSETVLARLEPLGEPAFELLSTAAVIGRRFDFDLLQHVSGLAEEELLPLVERLVQQQVLVEEGTGTDECFAFRHVLMQEVLYSHLLARRRRIVHRRVAAALEARPPEQRALSADALAYHYRAGGDDLRARAYAVLAGDQAARLYAWEDAEARYERALASLEGAAPDAPLEAQVLEKLVYVSWWQGRAENALEYAEDALALRRRIGEPRPLAVTLRHTGLLHAYHRGDWARGIALVREALSLLAEEPEDVEQARAANDLGRLLIACGEFDEAQLCLSRGLALAQELGSGAEECFTLAKLGYLAVLRGQVTAGLAQFEAARERMGALALPLDRATGIYYAGIRALEVARENARALEVIAAAGEYCERHGVAANVAIIDALKASVGRRCGRVDEALGLARRAVDDLRAAKRAEVREALRVLADVHRVRGDADAARRAYDEAVQLGDRESEVGIALLLLAGGRASEAAERLLGVLTRVQPGQHLLCLHLLAVTVEACCAAERFADALEMLEQLQEHVERTDYRAGPPAAAYATGLVSAASGDSAAAAANLEAAAAMWAQLGHPFDHARALGELARVLVTSDLDAERGAALGREAIAKLDALGAVGELERVRRLLRRTGVRVRMRPASGAPLAAAALPYGLTCREVDVLRELVTGHTNKEIAQALGITEKTVSIHVSHILAKLECATRTQAAAVALADRLVEREPAGPA
jgi:DNA-binding CsgD family transcriptional regulator/tetratricopeptide (TPR) repeat protein